MLVYANRLQVHGDASESEVFRAIGGWLKEQLGFGLHPELLLSSGVHRGQRGELRSQLQIFSCYDGEPALCAWVLKHGDAAVRGRRWTVEVGVKKSAGTLEVSCVVKTDEGSTLVSAPVSASQPRVIQYIVNNVADAKEVAFTKAVPGEVLRTVGEDRALWRASPGCEPLSRRTLGRMLREVRPTPAHLRHQPSRRTDRGGGRVAWWGRNTRRSADLSGVEGAEPLASPLFPQRVGWLSHLTVAQASPAATRETLLTRCPRRRWPGRRGQAPRPLGRQPHGRRGRTGRPVTPWRRRRSSRAARFPPCPYPRRPAIVALRRSYGP